MYRILLYGSAETLSRKNRIRRSFVRLACDVHGDEQPAQQQGKGDKQANARPQRRMGELHDQTQGGEERHGDARPDAPHPHDMRPVGVGDGDAGDVQAEGAIHIEAAAVFIVKDGQLGLGHEAEVRAKDGAEEGCGERLVVQRLKRMAEQQNGTACQQGKQV